MGNYRPEAIEIEIDIGHGKKALVSSSDAERVQKHKWGCSVREGRIYAKRTTTWLFCGQLKESTQYLHRFIMGEPFGKYIDHIDGNGLNCTRDNMKIVTPKENSLNQKSHRIGKIA